MWRNNLIKLGETQMEAGLKEGEENTPLPTSFPVPRLNFRRKQGLQGLCGRFYRKGLEGGRSEGHERGGFLQEFWEAVQGLSWGRGR